MIYVSTGKSLIYSGSFNFVTETTQHTFSAPIMFTAKEENENASLSSTLVQLREASVRGETCQIKQLQSSLEADSLQQAKRRSRSKSSQHW
jgi:hypothetical protein